MRYLVFLCSLLILSSCGRKKVDVGLNEAVIEMIDSVHDFGTYRGDSIKHVHTFRMKNVGTEPLIIHDLRTSCGCTATEYSREPVPPGGELRVKVTYDGSGRTPGSFSKTVDVYTSAKNGLKHLTIKGVVLD